MPSREVCGNAVPGNHEIQLLKGWRAMGKTVNHDEDLLPTDLVMARLVFGSNVARTEVSLSSSFC